MLNKAKPLPMARYGAALKGLGVDCKDPLADELKALMLEAKTAAASKPLGDHAAMLRRQVDALEREIAVLRQERIGLEQRATDSEKRAIELTAKVAQLGALLVNSNC